MGANMTAGAAGAAVEAGKTAAEMGVNATTGVCVCVYVRACACRGGASLLCVARVSCLVTNP